MSAQSRRSARIQALNANTKVQPIEVHEPKPKARVKVQPQPKIILAEDKEADFTPKFKYTVDWIQKARFHLSSLQNDLEDEDHMKILLDMIKEVEWTSYNINEWVQTLHGWYRQRNDFDSTSSKMSFSEYCNDLVDYRVNVRGNLNTCFQILKEEEQKISTEEHDEAYYFPPEKPSKARKIRSNKMVAHLNEFIKACHSLKIHFYKGDETPDNWFLKDDWINANKFTTKLFYEGSPMVTIRVHLTDEKRDLLLSLPNLSEFTDWKGEMKDHETSIMIRLP